MNFRDIMTATGRIAPEFIAKGRFEQDCVQGLEYAGRLSKYVLLIFLHIL